MPTSLYHVLGVRSMEGNARYWWTTLAEPVHKSCSILGVMTISYPARLSTWTSMSMQILYWVGICTFWWWKYAITLFSQLLIVLVSSSHATQLHATGVSTRMVVPTSRGSKTTTMRKPVEIKPQLGLRRWVIVKSKQMVNISTPDCGCDQAFEIQSELTTAMWWLIV